uniref:C-type lectin domain-containing protein n=1 Tax=Romanomermis culicivorax TaxID=13658 RepID=A0A915IX91_ROMCU
MMRLALQLFVFVGIVFNKNQALEMNAWVNFDNKYEYNYLSSNASREEARRTCSDIGAIMLELRNVEQLNLYEKTFLLMYDHPENFSALCAGRKNN